MNATKTTMNANFATAAEMSIELGCGTEIADECIRQGIVPVLVRDNGQAGDRRMSLWRVGDAEALDTNGGAIWDTGSAEEWADALAMLDGEAGK
jgi:hypothetical protein